MSDFSSGSPLIPSDPKIEPQPCGMWPKREWRECGKSALWGWRTETGGLVPICEDCIHWTGWNRKLLRPLIAEPSRTANPEGS